MHTFVVAFQNSFGFKRLLTDVTLVRERILEMFAFDVRHNAGQLSSALGKLSTQGTLVASVLSTSTLSLFHIHKSLQIFPIFDNCRIVSVKFLALHHFPVFPSLQVFLAFPGTFGVRVENISVPKPVQFAPLPHGSVGPSQPTKTRD